MRALALALFLAGCATPESQKATADFLSRPVSSMTIGALILFLLVSIVLLGAFTDHK